MTKNSNTFRSRPPRSDINSKNRRSSQQQQREKQKEQQLEKKQEVLLKATVIQNGDGNDDIISSNDQFRYRESADAFSSLTLQDESLLLDTRNDSQQEQKRKTTVISSQHGINGPHENNVSAEKNHAGRSVSSNSYNNEEIKKHLSVITTLDHETIIGHKQTENFKEDDGYSENLQKTKTSAFHYSHADDESVEENDDEIDDYVDNELTVEELETVINQDKDEILDSACLGHGSCIMIRSKSIPRTVSLQGLKKDPVCFQNESLNKDSNSKMNQQLEQQIPRNSPSTLLSAHLAGVGIGKRNECFHIFKLDHQSDEVLRFGDTIALLSVIENHPLGVRAKVAVSIGRESSADDGLNTPKIISSDRSTSTDYEVGVFRDSFVSTNISDNNTNDDLHSETINNTNAADQWTIVRGGTNHVVRIGQTAFIHRQKQIKEKQQQSLHKIKFQPIRSGEQVLLRNNLMGGYLSVQCNSDYYYDQNTSTDISTEGINKKIEIVTDSYTVNASKVTKMSLINKLQRHDKLMPTENQIFQILLSSVPPLPQWILRKNTNNQQKSILGIQNQQNFTTHTETGFHGCGAVDDDMNGDEDIDSVVEEILSTPSGQERILLDQVIGSLLGLEGPHIKIDVINNDNNASDIKSACNRVRLLNFRLHSNTDGRSCFDISLCKLVERIIPVSTTYIRLTAFLDKHFPGYEYGSIMHAFCEAVDEMIQEYVEYIVKLEEMFRNNDARLTMHELFIYIQPLIHSLSIVYKASTTVENLAGGAFLNALFDLKKYVCEGDVIASNIVTTLIEKSSIPYTRLLTLWLQHGELCDPYEEFMVEQIFHINRNACQVTDSNWINGFTASAVYSNFDNDTTSYDQFILREEHILHGLKTSDNDILIRKIFDTGKYWRAVRTCEKQATSTMMSRSKNGNDDAIPNNIDFNIGRNNITQLSSYIQCMYHKASTKLVSLLMNVFHLMDSLRIMKRYFLLDNGDFLIHFLDKTENELLKELNIPCNDGATANDGKNNGNLSATHNNSSKSGISIGRMQHCLRMAVQQTETSSLGGNVNITSHHHHASSFGNSKYQNNSNTNNFQRSFCPLSPLSLRCYFESESLIDHLDALNATNDNLYKSKSGENGSSISKSNRKQFLRMNQSRARHFHSDSSKSYKPTNKKKDSSVGGLTGVEAFVVDFPQIPFPLSLVLTSDALYSYKLLFRLLFFAKHVERRLVGIWRDHQAMKELSFLLQRKSKSFGQTFLLRQRMLHFSQNLIYYIMFEVIEPNWQLMEHHIFGSGKKQQQTIDDIIDTHNGFLSRTLESCLLTNSDLVRTLTKLIKTCIMFSDQMKLFMEATKIYDDSDNIATEKQIAIQRSLNDRLSGSFDISTSKESKSSNPMDSVMNDSSERNPQKRKKKLINTKLNRIKIERQDRIQKQLNRVQRELSSESYCRMISRFDEVFSAYLKEFMMQLSNDHSKHVTMSNNKYGKNTTSNIANLCMLLDYNGYISSSSS